MLRQSAIRLLAAFGHSGLGVGSSGIPAAALPAVSCSSSGTLRQLRLYSDDGAGGGKGEEEQAAAAAAATAAADPAASEEGSSSSQLVAAEEGEDALEVQSWDDVPEGLRDYDSLAMDGGEVVPPELFTKRQRAWMGLEDPDKYKHFLPKLSRKELGSFADEYAEEEFDVESDLYPTIPENVPLYNVREAVPELYQPRSDTFERMKRLKEERHPDMPIQQFISEVLGVKAPEDPPPYPGARPIIRWQIRHVYSVGVTEGHPVNKKVKAWVYLRDLQRECGLTDAALQHIAAICGPRYNPNRGELKLTSDKYPHREANRAHILQIINDLVEEGHRKHPNPDLPPHQQQWQPQQKQQQQPQQQAEAAS